MIQLLTLTSPQKNIDLSKDFSIEYSIQNNILKNEVSASLPIKLPLTANNREIFGYINRIDRLEYNEINIQVLLVNNSYIKKANLVILSFENNTFVGTLFFSFSNLLSIINEDFIDEFEWDTHKIEYNWGDFYSNEYKRDHLNNHPEKYATPPIVTSTTFTENPNRYGDDDYMPITTGLLIINAYNNFYRDPRVSNDISFLKLPVKDIANSNPSDLPFLEKAAYYTNREITLNNENFSAIPFYFMSPFLKLRYVLEKLFNFYNYEFNYDDFTDYNSDFEYIILLHNVIDVFRDDILDDKNLLPKISVKEFLNEIQKHFAGVFFIDEFAKKVKFTFYNDFFENDIDIDLTQFLIKKYNVTNNLLGKQLILKNNYEQNSEATVTTNSESTKNAEEITFNFLNLATIETPQRFYNLPHQLYVRTAIYKMIVMQEPLAAIISNPQYPDWENLYPIKDKEKTSKVLLATYSGDVKTGQIIDTNNNDQKTDWFRYTTSEKVFQNMAETNMAAAEILYEKYKEYLGKNYITIECEMNIPLNILSNIAIEKPKLFLGQKCFIEEIKIQMTSEKTTQTIILQLTR
ncbi:MAG: hypothetical protein LBS50_00400 [Prevotellaceae bacterium]|jgi:hypothetical protein|nr:hypothetical protein [Prevotellaceae bacterium]